jgi:SAM-dependent methyltransferase
MTVPLDWRRPEVRESYEMYWDDVSQFGMIHPRPAAEEVPAFYDVPEYYTRSEAASDRPYQVNHRHQFTVWLLCRLSWQVDDSVHIGADWFTQNHGPAKARILDVGCGSGEKMVTLAQAGHEVVGVEPDPIARQLALKRGLCVFEGTAEKMPAELEDGSFDAIIMTHVLEHCVEPVLAIENAVRLLKSGGHLTVETPNNAAMGSENAGTAWRWLDVPRHLNFFTPQSLRAVCELGGLTPVATEFRGYYRQFLPEWLHDEQYIWDKYKAHTNGNTAMPERNTEWRSWKLLLKTMFAPDDKKYDSVRVIARK